MKLFVSALTLLAFAACSSPENSAPPATHAAAAASVSASLVLDKTP